MSKGRSHRRARSMAASLQVVSLTAAFLTRGVGRSGAFSVAFCFVDRFPRPLHFQGGGFVASDPIRATRSCRLATWSRSRNDHSRRAQSFSTKRKREQGRPSYSCTVEAHVGRT